MENKIEMDNFSMLNYKAIELLAQLNCLNPSEKLIYKTESLLKDLVQETEKISYLKLVKLT